MAIDLRALAERSPDEETYWGAVEALARTDLCAYGLWVHGRVPVLGALAKSEHARVWADALEGHRQVLLVCPPEHGKSTFMRWHIEQWLGQQTEACYDDRGLTPPSALLVMNTAEQARKQCMSIAATLEGNRRYRALFPRVQPAKLWGWTKDTLYLHRPSDGTAMPDASLMATGILGPIQGARVGLIVVDDPTDQEDVRSDATVLAQVERHQGVLDDRLLEGGLKRDILTLWSDKGIGPMLIGAEDWHSLILPAVGQSRNHKKQPVLWEGSYPDYPWGAALWPEQWPVKRLEAKRKEKLLTGDSTLWQLAYQCDPTPAEGAMFKRTWIQRGWPADVPASMRGAA